MKVLFAIKTLSCAIGGAEKLASFISSSIARDTDFHVSLVTFDRPTDESFFPVDPLVQRHFLPVKDPGQKTGFTEVIRLVWMLRKLLKASRPDVIVAFMHSMYIPLQLASLGMSAKVVLSEHTVPMYYNSRKLEFYVLRILLIMTNYITIATESVKTLYPHDMRKKMKILPNPVLSDFIVDDEIAIKKNVLSVGRLNKDKDHEVLIRAFALLWPSAKDWTLKIYGDGEEREFLKKLIIDLSMQDSIVLAGTSKDMDSVYKSAALYVHPSRYESFGLASAEAMSHGLSVIGFEDCPGTSDVVKHAVNGLLVKHRSADDLSQAILSLIKNQGQRVALGRNAHQMAENWRAENVIDSWERYLRFCLE